MSTPLSCNFFDIWITYTFPLMILFLILSKPCDTTHPSRHFHLCHFHYLFLLFLHCPSFCTLSELIYTFSLMLSAILSCYIKPPKFSSEYYMYLHTFISISQVMIYIWCTRISHTTHAILIDMSAYLYINSLTSPWSSRYHARFTLVVTRAWIPTGSEFFRSVFLMLGSLKLRGRLILLFVVVLSTD